MFGEASPKYTELPVESVNGVKCYNVHNTTSDVPADDVSALQSALAAIAPPTSNKGSHGGHNKVTAFRPVQCR